MSKPGQKPSPKRGNGRGSVRKLPSGRWQWRASVELLNGEVKRVSGTVLMKTEAEAALRSALTDASRGQYAVTDKTTLEEYLRAWHEVRKPHQALTYARSHESMMETHIIPALGKRQLFKITPRDLEQFYANLKQRDPRRKATVGQPLSDSMKRLIHAMIHQAFADAVKHGDLLRNPTDVVRPRYTREAAREVTVKSWTEDEASRFYAVARQNPRGTLFCFMLANGLRIGETVGLRWENVELPVGRVNICESLVSVNGRAHRTTPKTVRARRAFTVTGDSLAILQEQPGKAALDAEAKGDRCVPSDAVFTNSIGGPILPDTVYGLMRRLCEEAEVPYKGTHVLRHSFISIQGLRGRQVEVVSAHVGHARASFTLDRYRTVFDTEREGLTLELPTVSKKTKK